ncbi:MAG: hypothetical protein P9M14_15870 [Candidatus Alcyoniella australis]|nr:hypothetical protein [Candidatus Alcyoniella australis]
MNWRTISFLLVITAAMALLIGCMPDSTEITEEIPTEGNDTFHFKVDEIALAEEVNEFGETTGRRGMPMDLDRDGLNETFYQVPYPKVGVFPLGFDAETGVSNAVTTAGIMDVVPGKTEYSMSILPLRSWLKLSYVDSVDTSRNPDQLTLVSWIDPVNQKELTAPITGREDNPIWEVFDLGSVKVNADPGADDDDDDDDDDDTPPVLKGCELYQALCEAMEPCASGDFTVSSCADWYSINSKNSEYRDLFKCIDVIDYTLSCGEALALRDQCWDENVVDYYGCKAQHAPDIEDVYYSKGGAISTYGESSTPALDSDQPLGIFFHYRDAEGDIVGGKIRVQINGGDVQSVDIPSADWGMTSWDSKAVIGVSVNGDIDSGEHTIEAWLVDNCGNAGNHIVRNFTANSGNRGSDTDLTGKRLTFSALEIFDPEVNNFNKGKGFIAQEVFDDGYFYEIEGFAISILQAYIWFIRDKDDSNQLEYDFIDSKVLYNTHHDGGTKSDVRDDSIASVFLFDEPMPMGILLIYGDAGWNLFHQGPYGSSDVNFVRGNWNDHVIGVPTQPIFQVKPDYQGCNTDDALCGHWVDRVDDEDIELADNKGNTLSRDKAVESCSEHSANPYWQCVVNCSKKDEFGTIGCGDLEDCVDECTWGDTANSMCDLQDNIVMHLKLRVPSRYANDPKHYDRLMNDDDIYIGVFVQGDGPVPGAYVKFDPARSNYNVPLAYGDWLPKSLFQNTSTIGDWWMQAYPGIFKVTDTGGVIYGSAYLPANETYEDPWYFLINYGFNWIDPTFEGWSLYTVSGKYIQDPYPWSTVIPITYGDKRAMGGDWLK